MFRIYNNKTTAIKNVPYLLHYFATFFACEISPPWHFFKMSIFALPFDFRLCQKNWKFKKSSAVPGFNHSEKKRKKKEFIMCITEGGHFFIGRRTVSQHTSHRRRAFVLLYAWAPADTRHTVTPNARHMRRDFNITGLSPHPGYSQNNPVILASEWV